jgi:endonuclease/exonuclease/phosphatase family metal-dependent hydrolase
MKVYLVAIGLIIGLVSWTVLKSNHRAPANRNPATDSDDRGHVRFATFNISFNRKTEGQLKEDLATGTAVNVRRIAEIIQRVRPNVILLNEFDFDPAGEGIAHFANNVLAVGQNGQEPIKYEHVYFQSVNTGVDTGLDLDGNGKLGTPNDAFGFGVFPGQYGMVVLSQFEIDRDAVRTFQNFLWKDMPDCLWPLKPGTDEPYYSDEIKQVFRLSSKSHWDVPIKVGERTIHFLVAHPTPPVFDKEEDRNGRRNHDEIRLFADYVSPENSGYLYDDQGGKGGLAAGSHFVIAGDMNADENDGDSSMNAAKQLTEHPLINHSLTPRSEGGAFYAKEQGQANVDHVGDPAFDTGDFSDFNVGNLHLDYCLPSKTLKIKNSGVFWPKPDQPGADLVKATDHRMVWVDIAK